MQRENEELRRHVDENGDVIDRDEGEAEVDSKSKLCAEAGAEEERAERFGQASRHSGTQAFRHPDHHTKSPHLHTFTSSHLHIFTSSPRMVHHHNEDGSGLKGATLCSERMTSPLTELPHTAEVVQIQKSTRTPRRCDISSTPDLLLLIILGSHTGQISRSANRRREDAIGHSQFQRKTERKMRGEGPERGAMKDDTGDLRHGRMCPSARACNSSGWNQDS